MGENKQRYIVMDGKSEETVFRVQAIAVVYTDRYTASCRFFDFCIHFHVNLVKYEHI